MTQRVLAALPLLVGCDPHGPTTTTEATAVHVETAATSDGPAWQTDACRVRDHRPCHWFRWLETRSAALAAAIDDDGWWTRACASAAAASLPDDCAAIPCPTQLVASELAGLQRSQESSVVARRVPSDTGFDPNAAVSGFDDTKPSSSVQTVSVQRRAIGMLIPPCSEASARCENPVFAKITDGKVVADCGASATCNDTLLYRRADRWEAVDTTEASGGNPSKGPWSIGGPLSCTGLLVDEGFVLTARHCACGDADCKEPRNDLQFVIDYTEREDDSTVVLAASRVVAIARVARHGPPDQVDGDWALLELSAHVASAAPVSLSTPASFEQCHPLYAIGHPRGRPSTFAGTDPHEGIPWAWAIFELGSLELTNLDLTAGNSGSPVFTVGAADKPGALVGIVRAAFSSPFDVSHDEPQCYAEGCAYLGFGSLVIPATSFAAPVREHICDARRGTEPNYCSHGRYRAACCDV